MTIPLNACIRAEYVNKSGPYWFAYWRDPETKNLKKKYVKSLDSVPRIIKVRYIARKNGYKYSTLFKNSKGGWIGYILARMHESGIYYYEDEKMDNFLDSELRKLTPQEKVSRK